MEESVHGKTVSHALDEKTKMVGADGMMNGAKHRATMEENRFESV